MAFIKPSTAFKASANWLSAEVRAYIKDQVATHLDTVADLRDADLERTRFVFIKTKAALYRLDLSSGAADDGDTVIHDNLSRRYLKIAANGPGGPFWDVAVDALADRDDYDDEPDGYAVFVADTGSGRAALYVMGDGGSADWSDPFYFTGEPGDVAEATTEQAGLMPAADKEKLDDLPDATTLTASLAAKAAGPESSTDGHVVQFDGTTGKLLKGGKAISTDGTLSADSDDNLPTEKAVKAYADSLIAAADAMVFQGTIDASANPDYPAGDRGDTYRISVAGKIGGASGPNVEAGDIILCLTDSSASGDHATVGASWSIIQVNIDGAVVGPASATDGHFAQFDGVSGKLIKGGKAAPSGVVVGTTDSQTLTNKTLTSPSITTPTGIVKGDVGLGNVDNTSDANKPVSTATQTALNLKAPLTLYANVQDTGGVGAGVYIMTDQHAGTRTYDSLVAKRRLGTGSVVFHVAVEGVPATDSITVTDDLVTDTGLAIAVADGEEVSVVVESADSTFKYLAVEIGA